MKPSLTDLLCTRCGICCSGELLADVELAPSDDSSALEALGLEIEEDPDRRGGELLIQPCAALRGSRCSIYAHRPKCCRTFECRLLKKTRLGLMTPEAALREIARTLKGMDDIRRQISRLGGGIPERSLKEAGQDILEMTESTKEPAKQRLRSELQGALAQLELQLHRTFLAPV